MPMQAHFPAGAAAAAVHSRPIKKLSPVSMRGNSQNGGQTTKSLLIKPQCSGVPNTAGSVAFLLLSTTLPAFWFAHFSVKCKKVQGRKKRPCLRSPAYKNRPGFHYGNQGGSFALFVLCQALTQLLAGVLDSSLSGCQNYRAFGVAMIRHS